MSRFLGLMNICTKWDPIHCPHIYPVADSNRDKIKDTGLVKMWN